MMEILFPCFPDGVKVTKLASLSLYDFLYLCICISAHMELSPPDLKGLGLGLIAIIVILLIVNIVLILLNIDSSTTMSVIARWTNLCTGIFTFAVAISALNCIATFIVLNIISLIINHRFFV